MSERRAELAIEIRVPALSESMASVKLVAWLKREGDIVAAGEPIGEFETDKATMEIESPSAGVLGRIAVPAGTEAVPVGTVIGFIFDRVEDSAVPPPSQAPQTSRIAPQASSVESVRPRSNIAAEGETSAPNADTEHSVAEFPSRGISATPLAERMVRLTGADISKIVSAETGRITKADVEASLLQRPGLEKPRANAQAQAVQPTDLATPKETAKFQDQPLSAIRRVTAERLQQAKQAIPHFYLHTECRVDALMNLRAQINARSEDFDISISVTDLLVIAAAQALTRVPLANSAWVGTAVRVYEDISIAVAVNTPRGLMTPVLRQCGHKSLREISRELKELVGRARDGRLQPHEYTGGTFTLSNLGMFKVTSITPIINPPQSCILGIGTIEQRALVTDGRIVAGHVMTCTLAADHRAIDGATGAELLAHIRRLLEDPLAMALQLS